ncbi:MAG TPA: DUF2723 domain-containing protein [Longimicrobiales bacterium]|nr:DUF2723 domain-containing protein [Longimicrobiales bacterium]
MTRVEEQPVPVARRRRGEPVVVEAYHPPYLAAGLAALGVFALYAITLSPTTWFWDTSEYIATGYIMGIPHPPGNPLFVVLARAWHILLEPTGLSTAVRINLFSAAMSAGAHGFWFLMADRILAFYSTDRTFRLIGASAAVLISATAFTVWNQSNVNEKVYTVTLFTIALMSWLAFRWREHLGRGKDDNLILLMVFILALSVGNHLMAFLAAPALVAFILLVEPRTLLNWRLYAAGVVAVILGLSVHLFLPIRSGLNPIINEAAPTCETVSSALVSVVTMGNAGCPDLSAALAREQYDKPSMFLDPVAYRRGQEVPRGAGLLVAQYMNYFQYFDWQWARSVRGLYSNLPPARVIFTLGFIFLGLFGAWSHYKRDRTSFVYVGLLFFTLAVGLTFYLNFQYGYTSGVSREMTEVRERDYFFIVSFSLWGVWAGIGLAALWLWLSQRLAAGTDAARQAVLERMPAPSLRPSWATAPVMVLALIPLFANWTWANRNYDYSARDWAYNLLMSVEPYGVLFTNGDNDTFPLWYLQEVEGLRRDVTVIVMSYLNTPWYAKQIRDLTAPCAPGTSADQDRTRIICQRPYLPSPAMPEYSALATGDTAGVSAEGTPGGPPTRSILPLDDAEIDGITSTPPYLTRDNLTFRAHNIEAVIPRETLMLPADVLLANIIDTAMGDRPIYFAMTTQAYDELSLRPFLIRHGVAFKLNDGPVTEDPARGIYAFPEGNPLSRFVGPYVDVPRTEKLLNEVFMHRGGFPDGWGHWVDVATENMPAYYGYSHLGMAYLYAMHGQQEASARHEARGNQWVKLANMRYDAANAR